MRGNATGRLPYAGRVTTVRRPDGGHALPTPDQVEPRLRCGCGAPSNLVVQEDLDGVRGYVGERERVARHVGGPRQETFARDGAGDDGRVQARRRVRAHALRMKAPDRYRH